MRRRLLALGIALTVAVTVTACDSGSGGTSGSGSATGTAASAASGSAGPGPSGASTTSSVPSGGGTASGSPGSAESSGPSSASGPSGSAAAAQDALDQLTLSELLGLIPDRDAYHQEPVVVNLYWKAAAAGGVTVPPAGAAPDARRDYAMALTVNVQNKIGVVGSDLAFALSQYHDTDPGFGLQDIAADVQTQTVPRVALAARGRFDLDAIDTALRGNHAWKDQLTTPTYRGHTIYRWEDDLERDLTKVNTGLFTQTGQSRRFSFPDSSTFEYSRDDASMHGLLDAGAGVTPSLADDEQCGAIADVLDGYGVYSAAFTAPLTLADVIGTLKDKRPAPPSSTVLEIKDRLSEYALHPYQMAGIGETLTDGQPQTVIVLANADRAAARANATALEKLLASGNSMITNRPWSDVFTVDSVTAKGSLTVAVLQPTGKDGGTAFTWWQTVERRDNLLMTSG